MDSVSVMGKRERGKMRRRLRRQQRVREALLLDLGALVYELHRQGRREPELLQAKGVELSAVDQEVRSLADALDEGEELLQLVAAGIAGSCDACGALLTSEDRFCSRCGGPTTPAIAGDRAPREEAAPEMATAGNGTGLEEEQEAPELPEEERAELETGEHPAVEADEEPEPESPPSPTVEPPPAPPPVPPPGPPPGLSAEPVADRALRAVRGRLRRGRDWLRQRR